MLGRIGAVLAVAAVVAALPASALASAGGARFFHSPSGNIQCEIDWHRGSGIPDAAFCQSAKAPRSVTLRPNGTLRLCTGTRCLGDGPENAFVLGYGKATRLGPFTCVSKVGGMQCTVASGRGFALARSGVRRLP